ncbi:MAG TPA: hypothetical protein VE710_23575 [Candidatus Bathyarchaeia archaeon]|nr:hypothetical protein [Candidatus Bathyarchaeia archaeon]
MMREMMSSLPVVCSSVGAGFHGFDQNGDPTDEELKQRIKSSVQLYLDLARKLSSRVTASSSK